MIRTGFFNPAGLGEPLVLEILLRDFLPIVLDFPDIVESSLLPDY